MKKNSLQFLFRLFLWSFSTATGLFVLFFLALSFSDNAKYPPLAAAVLYLPAAAVVLLGVIPVFRFRNMIVRQTALLGIPFSDQGAQPLYPGSLTALSEQWLIVAGRIALCRPYIKHISVKTGKTNMGNDYRIKILTIDQRVYTFHSSPSDIRKIQSWMHAADKAERT